MPNFDGTGPYGYGRGLGYGQGGCGAGRFSRWAKDMPKEEEINFVSNRIKMLEQELIIAKERLDTLKDQ